MELLELAHDVMVVPQLGYEARLGAGLPIMLSRVSLEHFELAIVATSAASVTRGTSVSLTDRQLELEDNSKKLESGQSTEPSLGEADESRGGVSKSSRSRKLPIRHAGEA